MRKCYVQEQAPLHRQIGEEINSHTAYATPLKVHSNHLIKLIRWTEHAKKHGVTFKVKSVDRCVEVI